MTGWAVLVFNRSSDGRRRIFKPMVTLTSEPLTERAYNCMGMRYICRPRLAHTAQLGLHRTQTHTFTGSCRMVTT